MSSVSSGSGDRSGGRSTGCPTAARSRRSWGRRGLTVTGRLWGTSRSGPPRPGSGIFWTRRGTLPGLVRTGATFADAAAEICGTSSTTGAGSLRRSVATARRSRLISCRRSRIGPCWRAVAGVRRPGRSRFGSWLSRTPGTHASNAAGADPAEPLFDPARVIQTLIRHHASVLAQMRLELATFQAARSIVIGSAWPAPIGGARPSSR